MDRANAGLNRPKSKDKNNLPPEPGGADYSSVPVALAATAKVQTQTRSKLPEQFPTLQIWLLRPEYTPASPPPGHVSKISYRYNCVTESTRTRASPMITPTKTLPNTTASFAIISAVTESTLSTKSTSSALNLKTR